MSLRRGCSGPRSTTPAHKPINIGHDETQIIGHIVTSKAVDKTGGDITVEEGGTPPEELDLEVAGVLYKDLPAIAEKVARVIEDAHKGEAFVSMEVWFDDFDYAVRNPANGETKIVPRTAESAFLTKHLRSYGGTGTYENFQVGRVLRGLEFAGKGIVDNPANPESVIKEAVAQRAAADVNSNKEPKGGAQSMANKTETTPTVEELQAKLTEAESKLAEANKALEAKTTECAAATAALDELRGKGLDKQVETLTAGATAKDKEIETLSAAKTAAESKLAEAVKRAEKAESELAEIRETEKARNRMAELAKVKKIEDEKATLAELKGMSDETFALVLKYAGQARRSPRPRRLARARKTRPPPRLRPRPSTRPRRTRKPISTRAGRPRPKRWPRPRKQQRPRCSDARATTSESSAVNATFH